MLFKNQNFMVDAWYVLLTETVFSGPLSFLISLVDKVVCKHPHVFAKNCKKLQFMRGIWTIQWLSFRRDILHTIESTYLWIRKQIFRYLKIEYHEIFHHFSSWQRWWIYKTYHKNVRIDKHRSKQTANFVF